MIISDISIKRPVFALMVILVPIVFGILAYPKIGLEQFPSVEFPIVTVTATYPGADPESMEAKVAKPIEDALSSMGGVKTMTSYNLESVTQVMIQFDLDVDANLAVQDVRDRIASIPDLPEEVETPKVQKFDIGATPILSLAIVGNIAPRDLTDIADNIVKERVARVQGVGNVELVGGREREIHVVLDPARMASRGVTPGDVAAALQAQNLDLPAGRITEGKTEIVVTTKGAFTRLQELADATVTSIGGAHVRIGDVAIVQDSMAEQRSHASVDGVASVALVIQKESGANTVAVSQQVHRELAALQPVLAARGVTITVTDDQAPYVEQSFADVEFDLLLGGLLAIVIVFAFLRDWRATFISALALPTSVIATVWFLQLLGFSFNMMTMLALSLSIGLLIDDAIVVVENIHRHLEQGKTPMKAAAEATSEIGLAVLATTLSIVAVFAPVALMEGIIGRFFFQFGITVSIAVMLSLFISFTLTPLLAARMLKPSHGAARRGLVSRGIDVVLDGIERGYRRLLAIALRRRAWTLGVATVVMIGSCALVTQVPAEFIPVEDRGKFTFNVELPSGTSLAVTTEVVEVLAADLRAHAPGVTSAFVTIGSGAQGQSNLGAIQVNLVDRTARDYRQQDAMAWVREHYAPLADAGIKFSLGQISGTGAAGAKTQQIQINLRSNDMPALIAAAAALQDRMAAMPTLVDLDSSHRAGKPQIELTPNRAAASELGVFPAAIAQTVRALVSQDKITDYKEGVELYDVRLIRPEAGTGDFAELTNLGVRAQSGAIVPLEAVVSLERTLGPSQIDRQAKMRQITLYANPEGVTLGEAIIAVEAAAAEVVPAAIEVELGGTSQMMQESMGYMLVSLVLAILLVYMILAAQFESFIHPFTIMMSLPLAVAGAFGGLFIAGQALSIFAMIGLIMLMGLVTKNAILLVDYANRLMAAGAGAAEAMLEAGPVRLRPILMTTAAMILGMLPIAMAHGAGGEQRAPMAVVVIGGLITSTLLTLVVVPVVFSLVEGMRRRLSRKRPIGQLGADAP